ncbi:MAG: extracellular solute-binding protein [Clostridia bacterium]|nr:extracellular solute-binding protein [Clostridia bacterium]
MKKLLTFVLAAAIAVSGLSFMTGCTKRSEQLKLFSQGEYMDEDLFEEFEKWYKAETGETVKVSMTDFNSNEDMYTKISMDHADYDLICPSDYMIEKMIKDGLCVPVELDISADGLFKSEYVEITETFDPELKYSVPYMFGTFGIMYNAKSFEEPLTSWADLFEYNRDKTLYLKRSVRDTYHAASLYVKRESLRGLTGAAQKEAVQNVFNDTSSENISAVQQALKAWKGNGKHWDNEDGKFAMAGNKGDAGLFWSCDAGYVMSDYENDDGNVMPGNKDLWFTIPEEGGNVYLDSFVISKYAKNTKAANYFLKFLCTKEAAIANSLYCGAISPVAAAYDELKKEYESMNPQDEDNVFSGTSEEWKQMYIDMLFPNKDVLNRCGQMRDYGANEGSVVRAIVDIMM